MLHSVVVLSQESARLLLPIRLLTREALYVAAGTADGLRAGDSLSVVRSNRIIARLEVKFVAEHSASCLLGNAGQEIRDSDFVVWSIPRTEFLKRTQRAEETSGQNPVGGTPVANPRAPQRSTTSSSRRRASKQQRLTGAFSVQTLLQRDKSASQFDYLAPSAYLRLRLERIGNTPLQWNLRLRSRQNYRADLSGGLQHQETMSRFYEMSLSYAPADAAVELAAGRMLRNDLRGLGYLDGLLAAYKINQRVKAGIFFGSEPESYRASFQPDDRKMGGFVHVKTAVQKNAELSSTLTAIGRYANQQLSREFLVLQNDFTMNRRFYFSQYLEMDINRRWRREMGGKSVSFSDLFFNATYYVQPSLSFSLAYDARKNIRTWETHNLADSLFDDALRQGVHLGAQMQPFSTLRLSVNGGMRTTANRENVYSGSLAVTQSNLLSSGIGLSGRLSYYGNSSSTGYYPGADISWRLFHRVNGSVGMGAYVYDSPALQKQTNLWERLRVDVNLTHRWHFSSTFENFHGDSMNFIRAFLDLGLRF